MLSGSSQGKTTTKGNFFPSFFFFLFVLFLLFFFFLFFWPLEMQSPTGCGVSGKSCLPRPAFRRGGQCGIAACSAGPGAGASDAMHLTGVERRGLRKGQPASALEEHASARYRGVCGRWLRRRPRQRPRQAARKPHRWPGRCPAPAATANFTRASEERNQRLAINIQRAKASWLRP
jgi:hypothetical protein